MNFTKVHLEIVSGAYLASLDARGVVIADDAFPQAHQLAEQGWLERRFEPDGEMSWWWTRQADTALAFNALTRDAEDRAN